MTFHRRRPATGRRCASNYLYSFVFGALSTLAGPVLAQTGELTPPLAESSESGSTIVYGTEFFAQYEVANVEQILRRIPGVSAILNDAGGGGDRRGFGSDGEQILINGRRLAGKSNEISSALSRIPIQQLAQVELIRGTSSDIDVRSDGVVVNIVLKEGASASGSGSAKVAAQLDESGWLDADVGITYNGDLGQFTYFAGLERITFSPDGGGGGYSYRVRDERYYYSGGELMAVRNNQSNLEGEQYLLVMNSAYFFDRGDTLQLNALISDSSEEILDDIRFTSYDQDGRPSGSGIEHRSSIVGDKLELEVGGTYETHFGDDDSIKILGLYTSDETSKTEGRNDDLDGILYEVSRNPSDVLETEAILRGSYFKRLTGNQTIEAGAELARNTLDQTIAVFADLDGDGRVEHVDIFNPSPTVEEIRSDVFVNHNWTLSNRWTAASSLVVEHSKISQRGADLTGERTYKYLKPRIDIRFSPTADDQWRFKLERTVSQLDFGNFVPKYNLRDDRFSAGNPVLQPETAWEYEAAYEHRLRNDEGVVAARAYYRQIQERIESVGIDVDGDGNLDPAAGNIGDATDYGVELSFSLRMARLNMPNLILDGSWLRRETNVTDPFTGVARSMGQTWDGAVRFGLRHDIAADNVSWGVAYQGWAGSEYRSEWEESRYFTRTALINAFLEKRFGTRWTLRIDAWDVTHSNRKRTRLLYADNAIDGNLQRTEYFSDTRNSRYTIGLIAAF